ncbi:MAG: hypothetical protein OEV72_14750, partial [Thermoleophilia bacterium]|nr:hypothetical protein [Thermoleophilia bacterium]
ATPPTSKPKPKPKVTPKAKPKKVDLCRTIRVTPKMVKANGRAQTLVVTVVQGKKPAKGVKVRIKGPGIKKAVVTNAKGKVRVRLTPRTSGIVMLTIVNAKPCNTQRIGVVGVFEPPVTG